MSIRRGQESVTLCGRPGTTVIFREAGAERRAGAETEREETQRGPKNEHWESRELAGKVN